MCAVSILVVLLIYITASLIIGNINFNEHVKQRTFLILALIYNLFLCFLSTIYATSTYFYFINRPNGLNYFVPESERSFNLILGVLSILISLSLLVPINIYFKRKSKYSWRQYAILFGTAVLMGLILYVTLKNFISNNFI